MGDLKQGKNCNTCQKNLDNYGDPCDYKNSCGYSNNYIRWKPIPGSIIWTKPGQPPKELINDGGTRVAFETGATREGREGKGRYDLITPVGLERLAKWYELGAQKYKDRNWENGLPISNCLDSLMRHTTKYLAGMDDEDHLAAIVWNAFAIMHFEKHKPEMMDLPTRQQVATAKEE